MGKQMKEILALTVVGRLEHFCFQLLFFVYLLDANCMQIMIYRSVILSERCFLIENALPL